MNDAISRVTSACHTCASLKSFPSSLVKQSSDDPPEVVGVSFAADVIKRYRQLILVLRECTTSFTASCLVHDEKHDTLRDGLTQLIFGLHPLDGPRAIIRVDPSMANNDSLNYLNVTIDVGRDKSRARDRYIVVSIDFPWCFVKKFSGSQLRATSYKVKLSECYATSPPVIVADHSGLPASQDQDDEPSPATPAVPAASVSPESPPPAPPELTSVPSDEEQFPSSTCDDTTLEAPI
ncbi:unnamed protein product, partial [Porites lobata]